MIDFGKAEKAIRVCIDLLSADATKEELRTALICMINNYCYALGFIEGMEEVRKDGTKSL